jgi:hypothetical protein
MAAGAYKIFREWVALKNGRKIKVRFGKWQVDTTQLSVKPKGKFISRLALQESPVVQPDYKGGILVDEQHTVLLIEHDVDVIKTADHVIDLGHEGGHAGGRVVVTGTPEEVAACKASHTGRFLRTHLRI